MSVVWKAILSSHLRLAVSCLSAQVAAPASHSYHHSVSLAENGKPFLQLTNDSNLPIAAFFMAEFPSLGMEGRTYYDYYVSDRQLPIAPGSAIIRGLSSFRGSEAKVRAEARAVVFQDGTTAGDPVWVNAILARRLRFYDRTVSLYALLEKQVGTGISRDALVDLLKATQAEADQQLPEDELRVMDDLAFYGAISTIDKNRQVTVETVLQRYLGYLRLRAAKLKRSRPELDTVRTLPVSIPKPLSDASLPADLRASRLAYASSNVGLPADLLPPGAPHATYTSNTTGAPSYCEILNAALNANPVQPPLAVCALNGLVQSQEYTFSAETFTQYNGVTNTTADPPWSSASSANQGPFESFGVCYGTYPNCSGDGNDYYFIGPNATGYGAANLSNVNNPVTRVTQGQSSAPFYWILDQYPYPTDEGCDPCDPNPGGKNPSSANAPVPTAYWAFDYACNVTP